MSINNNAPIGVFDSGVGGLTVVREIMRNLPEERIVYFRRYGPSAVRFQVCGHGHPLLKTDRPLSSDTGTSKRS